MRAEVKYSEADVKAMVIAHATGLAPEALPHLDATESYGTWTVTMRDDAEQAAKVKADEEYEARRKAREAERAKKSEPQVLQATPTDASDLLTVEG